VLLCGLVLAAAGCGGSNSSSATTTTAAADIGTPCGSMTGPPPAAGKVMVIVMENTTFGSVIGSQDAPTINALAGACALASDYHGIQFPSLPNYIQMTSGTAPQSIAGDGQRGSDCSPASDCQSTDPSIFSQITAAGLRWKSYAESMPSNCFPQNTGEYAPRHNPAVYYINEHAACAKFDVPMGTTAKGALTSDLRHGTLPDYSFVAPNLCNDGHDSCGGTPQVVEEDRFVTAWLPRIVASPDYQSGKLTVILTADTSSSSDPGNHLATIVASRLVPVHTTATGRFDHYSLLRLTEDLTGVSPHLGAAATAADMRPQLGLG
jgi:phosphatidylinositol-3-phosphatase